MAPTHYTTDLPIQSVESAHPAGAKLLAGAQEKLGFVPNMYGAMANLPALLETYQVGYAGFRETAGFRPDEQETIFLAISYENGCTYCLAAHSRLAEKLSGVPADCVAALREGGELPDPRLQALARFTRHLVRTGGRAAAAEVAAFREAGFTEVQILGIVLALAVKTISNTSNHLFGTPVDEAFAGHRVETLPAGA